jgi:hypothetical protein
MPKVLVTFSEKIYEEIEKEAEKMGLSKSAFVRFIVMKYLTNKGE